MATVSLSVSTVKPLADRVFVKVSASEGETCWYFIHTAKENHSRGKAALVLEGNDDVSSGNGNCGGRQSSLL